MIFIPHKIRRVEADPIIRSCFGIVKKSVVLRRKNTGSKNKVMPITTFDRVSKIVELLFIRYFTVAKIWKLCQQDFGVDKDKIFALNIYVGQAWFTMKKSKHHHASHNSKKSMIGNISQKYIIGSLGVVIAVLILGIFLIGEGRNIFNQFFASPTPTPTPSQGPSGPPPTPTPIFGDTIMYDGYRFTPNTLNASVGQVINIANLGIESIEIISDDSTEDGKKFNLGVIEVGDTSQFIELRTSGVYSYYNRLNPEQQGRVVVQ